MSRATRGAESGPKDDGSLSLFFIICSLGFLLLVGLVLDGGGRLLAKEKADAVAREAARAACQSIDHAALLGGHYRIDLKVAVQATHDYLAAAHAVGSDPVITPGQCRVTVSDTYYTALLGLMGIHTIKVHGTGTAQYFHGVTGPEGT